MGDMAATTVLGFGIMAAAVVLGMVVVHGEAENDSDEWEKWVVVMWGLLAIGSALVVL